MRFWPMRRDRWLAAIGVALLTATTIGGVAVAETAPSPAHGSSGSAALSDSPAVSSEVLLISGDRVTHTVDTDGTTTITVDAADRLDGTPVAFETVDTADGHYVIPTDAYPLLAAGVVDEQLFNVTTLVEDGLANATQVPVIVTGMPDDAVLNAADLSAATTPTVLDSIDGIGITLEQTGTSQLWQQLTGHDAPRTASTMDRGPQVWLDRAVQVSLQQSVPQVGAPQVWQAGYDGSGVTVAVLDTGVDADHPDVAGRIIDTANFTQDPDRDGHGHGTHVAATVAGSGTASGGAHRGVAPGADLLIGKVVPDSGTGPTSAVIEGMQWAAHAGADIVNVSLGGPVTDGNDPASQAVDALTEQTGALFVIASGNNEGDAAVNAPGAATSALTVGGVNKQDELASFSNRGPRWGDGAVKPEITAPGAAIVAARAAGTSMGDPVDEYYTSAGGTSMATPHVAGAAALLAQARPDWDWSQLKDALVSTATSGSYRVFEGGAGRLDVATAVASGVYGPAAANVGAFAAPYDEQRAVDLAYRNHGEEDVTLQLAVTGQSWDGDDLPEGAVTLSDTAITVPGGGTAEITLTVDATAGEVGAYAGMITATGDEVVLRTPLSYYKSTGSNELTVTNLDFRGQPQSGQAIRAIKLDGALPNNPFHEMQTWDWSDDDGMVRLQVADGLYDIYGGDSSTWDFHGDGITLTVQTETVIDRDLAVTLDARDRVKVGPDLADRTDLKSASVTYERQFDGGRFSTGFMISYDPVNFYMQQAEHTIGTMQVREYWNLADPLVTTAEVHRGNGQVLTLQPEYHNYFAGPVIAGEHDLELVDAGTGSDEELARARVAGKAALVAIPVPTDVDNPYTEVWRAANDITDAAAAQDAAGVLIYVDEPGALALHNLRSQEIPQLSVSWEEGIRARAMVRGAHREPARLVVEAHADPTDLYQLRYAHPDATLPQPRWQVDPGDLVTVQSRYHADEPGWVQNMVAIALLPDQDAASGLNYTVRTPLAVNEHILAGDHLRWHRVASQRGPDVRHPDTRLVSREVFLPGDERQPEIWFQSPMRTGAADRPQDTSWGELMCTSCRHGDVFRPGLWYLDSDPRHYQRSYLDEGTVYRMFSDGEEIPNTGSSFTPSFELSAEPATYRLEMEGIQPGVPRIRTLAPRIGTVWTFHSTRPDADAKPDGYSCPASGETGCAVQPLLQLDYQLDLDLLNRAPAGARHVFDVHVGMHSAVDGDSLPMISRFDLWYSTDEGQTWQPARVRPDRQRTTFEVTVSHPPLSETDGYVWLRADARDSAGNRVEQTIERAYGLS